MRVLGAATILFASTLLAQETTASFRGLHVARDGAVWASGTHGTILRRTPSSPQWQTCAIPPDGGQLDFRGISAFSAQHAFALSSGPGPASRLFETTDGCQHWNLILENKDQDGFWDVLVFADPLHGYLLGDPVAGRFVLWTTASSGAAWKQDTSDGLRAQAGEAKTGEALFAASNSSLAAFGDTVWFATGGTAARVFRLKNGHWTHATTTLAASASAGIFSIAFRDAKHGVVVGGDYRNPNQAIRSAAFSGDGGETWLPAVTMPGGYRSSVAWSPQTRQWVTTGPNGTDVSKDDGKTWQKFSSQGGNVLSPPWVAGSHGLLTALSLSR